MSNSLEKYTINNIENLNGKIRTLRKIILYNLIYLLSSCNDIKFIDEIEKLSNIKINLNTITCYQILNILNNYKDNTIKLLNISDDDKDNTINLLNILLKNTNNEDVREIINEILSDIVVSYKEIYMNDLRNKVNDILMTLNTETKNITMKKIDNVISNDISTFSSFIKAIITFNILSIIFDTITPFFTQTIPYIFLFNFNIFVVNELRNILLNTINKPIDTTISNNIENTIIKIMGKTQFENNNELNNLKNNDLKKNTIINLIILHNYLLKKI